MLPIARLALLALAAHGPGSLETLVSRIAQVYAGNTRIVALRETGTLESSRGIARTVRVFAAPDRLRIEILYPNGAGEVRVLDGRKGWRNGEPVDGPPRDAMVLQAARLDVPGILLRNRRVLVDLGEVNRNGKTFRAIGIPTPGNLNLAITVDSKTARIVRSEGAMPMGGGQVRFATDYSEFRTVHGALFAFHEVNFASGQKTGETTLQKVELLGAVPQDAFRP